MKNATSVRIEESKLSRLDALAETMGLSRGQAINDAIDRYLEHNDWFLAAVDKGLEDSKQGRVISDEEMKATFRQWGVDCD